MASWWMMMDSEVHTQLHTLVTTELSENLEIWRLLLLHGFYKNCHLNNLGREDHCEEIV